MKREWLIAYRKAKNLSQEEVADAISVSASTYSSYEVGARTPKPNVSKKLAKIFGFKWTKFYEENSNVEE